MAERNSVPDARHGRFHGKVLFATGAASGIAAAVAQRFTAEGGLVAVVDLHEETAKRAADSLPGAIGLGADVADEDAVRAAVAAAAAHFGHIDSVVNAAGIVDGGPLEDYGYDRWQRTMAVHAGGTFLVTKHTVPHLRRAGAGSIVNIASVAAVVAQPGNFAYGAAKAAIVGFTRQIANDLASEHIRVNVVAPGRVRTGMTTPMYERRGGGDYAEGARLSAEHNMQKRIAEPEERAAVILFLLSDDASFVTAATMIADGGETVI